MQSDSSTSSTSDTAPATQGNSAPASQAHSSQTAGSNTQARKSRTQTKWLEDKVTATRLDEQGWPTPDAARERFILVCGLIARERVSINVKIEDLTLEMRRDLFTILEENLEYPANLSTTAHDKAIKSAMKEIALLQR